MADAINHTAIHWHLLARTDAQLIAGLHLLQRNILFMTIVPHDACCFGCKPQQQLDCRIGLAAGAQLQHLPQQYQRCNTSGGFEIDRHHTHRIKYRARKNIRHKRRYHAVTPRHPHTQSDEREHVEITCHQRLPATDKKGPTAPQHYRRGEQHLQQLTCARLDNCGDTLGPELCTHGADEYRNGEHRADPKAACHIV